MPVTISDKDFNAAVNIVMARGCRVVMPVRPADVAAMQSRVGLTMTEVARRLGMNKGTVGKRLVHPGCPRFPHSRHFTGRLDVLTLTEELEAFLRAPLQPGRRLKVALPYVPEVAKL